MIGSVSVIAGRTTNDTAFLQVYELLDKTTAGVQPTTRFSAQNVHMDFNGTRLVAVFQLPSDIPNLNLNDTNTTLIFALGPRPDSRKNHSVDTIE